MILTSHFEHNASYDKRRKHISLDVSVFVKFYNFNNSLQYFLQ